MGKFKIEKKCFSLLKETKPNLFKLPVRKKIATFKNEWPCRFDGKTLKCRQGVKCELHGKEREKISF